HAERKFIFSPSSITYRNFSSQPHTPHARNRIGEGLRFPAKPAAYPAGISIFRRSPMTPQPTQPESGKPRCRLNAFRHGLTGHVYVLTEAEAPRFHKHYNAIRDHYKPSGPIEASLVDQIANGIWRLQRANAIEEGIFALDSAPDPEPESGPTTTLVALAVSAAGAANCPGNPPGASVPGPTRTWLTLDKAFDLLAKYERRIQRSLDRDKAELAALQSERKHQTALDMDRAVALHRLAKSEGKAYDPSIFQPAHLTPE